MKQAWNTKSFENCIKKVPYTPKIQRKDFLDDGAYPIVSQEIGLINGYWNDENDVFKVKSPLVLFGDHTKLLKFIDFDFVLGADGVKILQPEDFLLPTFFYYQLQNVELCSLGYARHYRLLKEVNICFPDLAEQQRIVSILDEAFEGIATATANAELNMANARDVFQSHLASVFMQEGNDWIEKNLGDVCRKITDGTHHSPKIQYPERGPGLFPYITSKNIRNNFMDLTKIAYIERSFHEEVYARCKPNFGDVLLTKDGAGTGNVTLNTIDEPFSLLSSVCLLKTKQELLNPGFLCYYLQSPLGLSSIVGQMTGAAIKRIVLKDIKKALIRFPPLEAQCKVVATLDSLFEESQRLEAIYRQKLDALAELRKSILHQAFSGQLQ